MYYFIDLLRKKLTNSLEISGLNKTKATIKF